MLRNSKAVLRLLEFIDEIFPHMCTIYGGSSLFPVNVVIVGAEEQSMEGLLKPKCEALSKECDINFRVAYEPRGDEEEETPETTDSVFNPRRQRDQTFYNTSYIYFEDSHDFMGMWLVEQGNPKTADVS